MGNWTLFSNHGHVLVCLARDSKARLRDVAVDVGITERAVQKIVRDLQDGGMVSVTKNGRRNNYRIHKKQNLRHDLEEHRTLRDFLSFVRKTSERKRQLKPAANKSKAIGIEAISPPIKQKKPRSRKTNLNRPESGKSKSAKTNKSDSIERQQGSLF